MALKALFYPDVPFDTLYVPWILKEIYIDKVYADVLNGHEQTKDLVIVDVGANIGLTVSHFQRFARHVFAVEPSSINFEALQKNVEFNGWANVDLTQCAIADADGVMDIHYNPSNLTSNSLLWNFQGPSEKVKTLRMDTFFAQKGIEAVDFMKFDVEGAEDLILRSEGFRNVAHKIRAMEVELHHPSWPALVEYMVHQLGFSAKRHQADTVLVMFTRN